MFSITARNKIVKVPRPFGWGVSWFRPPAVGSLRERDATSIAISVMVTIRFHHVSMSGSTTHGASKRIIFIWLNTDFDCCFHNYQSFAESFFYGFHWNHHPFSIHVLHTGERQMGLFLPTVWAWSIPKRLAEFYVMSPVAVCIFSLVAFKIMIIIRFIHNKPDVLI